MSRVELLERRGPAVNRRSGRARARAAAAELPPGDHSREELGLALTRAQAFLDRKS